jgi:hypothetical protein
MRRKLLILALVLLVAVGVLAMVEFDSPRLGGAVLQRAGTALGTKVTARSFRLGVIKGLSLEGVEASSSFTGGSYQLALEKVIFRHRLLPLLTGRVNVERIVLDRPRLLLAETGKTPPRRSTSAPAAAALPAALSLRVEEAAVRGGSLELRSRDLPAPVIVSGLDLKLRELDLDPARGPFLAGLTGEGEVAIESITFARTRVREAEGRLRIAEGKLETEGVRFVTDEGRFEAKLVARLERLPLAYSLVLKGDPLDLNVAAGAGKGGGFGPALLDLTGEGVGPESAGLNGQGRLKLEAGSFPSAPLLKAIEAVLGRTRLVGARYRASETPFRIERGRVLFEGFRLDADQVGLEAGGAIDLAGPLNLTVAVRTPREGLAVGGVSSDVLDALTDDAGFVRLPLRVTGTQERPRVTPDLGALAAQARQGGLKVLGRKAGEKLKGWFSRDK